MKHETAPEEWTKILAHNYRKYLARRQFSRGRVDRVIDDLVAEGWCATLQAQQAGNFDTSRSTEDKESYLLTAAMTWLRGWAQRNHPQSESAEPRYARTYQSLLPELSMNRPIRSSDETVEVGALVPTDCSDRLLEVECRLDLVRSIGNERTRQMVLMRLDTEASFSEIAKAFGLSSSRVGQLFEEHLGRKVTGPGKGSLANTNQYYKQKVN